MSLLHINTINKIEANIASLIDTRRFNVSCYDNDEKHEGHIWEIFIENTESSWYVSWNLDFKNRQVTTFDKEVLPVFDQVLEMANESMSNDMFCEAIALAFVKQAIINWIDTFAPGMSDKDRREIFDG